MYIFAYTQESDGRLFKSYRCKPSPNVPKAAVAIAAAEYISNYVEDFGCDFDDVEIKMFGEACQLTLVSDCGEDGVMYFSIHEYDNGGRVP